MRRLTFNLLAAASLLLGVAACGLWAQSYSSLMLKGWQGAGGSFYTLGSGGGRIVLDRTIYQPGVYPSNFPSYQWECFGLIYSHYKAGDFHVEVTYGALVAVAALLPFAWIIAYFRRRRRRRSGFCTACGYNLIGNESGVCPECGVPAKAVSTFVKSSDLGAT